MSYTGKKATTKADLKLAKKHLKMTYDLNKKKIKDHKKALKKKGTDKKYNLSHIDGHIKDNKGISKVRKSYAKMKKKFLKKRGG